MHFASRCYRSWLLLSWLIGALLLPSASATHLKLFVLTGQSNSLGTTDGDGADPSPGTDPADREVRFYWHNLANATKSLGDSGGEFTTLREQQGGFYKGSATHWGRKSALVAACISQGCGTLASLKPAEAAAAIRSGPRPPPTTTCMTTS